MPQNLSFRAKLTLLFFALSLTPLLVSTAYFLRLYRSDKIASLFDVELQNTIQAAGRIENLISVSREIPKERIAETKDIILIAESPCTELSNNPLEQAPFVSPLYEKSLSLINISPRAWLQTRALKEACFKLGGNSPSAPILLSGGPKFSIPYLQVLLKGQNSDRMIILSMDGLGGSSGFNLFFLTNPEGTILWSNGTDEDLENLSKNYGPEITRYSQAAFSSGIPSITRLSSRDEILAYTPFQPGFVLFSTTSESAALAPVAFILKQSLIFTLGWIFLYLFVGKFAASRLSAPLNVLREASEKFGAGDLGVRIKVQGTDEISKVQNTFNDMANHIVKLVEDTKIKAAIESDVAIAEKVQQWFSPGTKVKVENHEMHSFIQMAQKCGGDWWGYLEVKRAQGSPILILLIGDAAGHGISSALLTAAMQGSVAILTSWIEQNPDLAISPDQILRVLNQVINRVAHGEIHMSFLVASIDPDAHTMLVANAGHNKPYLLLPKEDGGFDIKPVGGSGAVLGYDLAEKFEDVQTYPWPPGAQLFLYTDGLIDCMKGEETLYDRRTLIQALKKFGKAKGDILLRDILKDRKVKLKGLIQEDDITAVVCVRGDIK